MEAGEQTASSSSAPAAAPVAARATGPPPGPPAAGRLRLLSFNIGMTGLRGIVKEHKTLARFLDSLNADIVCLQETKLRGGVDRELALAEGWDSFFACDATHATGYAGVATFVRSGVALPFAAEEGFTGCAPRRGNGGGGSGGSGAVVPHPALEGAYSPEELMELDAEGRVLVTDHGAFVLFNLYGPAVTSSDPEAAQERAAFKRRFYRALELRWRDLLARGRPVVAAGDFNISPAPIDTREPGKVPEAEFYNSHRRWLRRLLHGAGAGAAGLAGTPAAAALDDDFEPGRSASGDWPAGSDGDGGDGDAGSADGRFTDAFRALHPDRQGACTCWSTASAARANNYGSRIDLILTAGLGVGAPPPAPAAGAPAADAPSSSGDGDGGSGGGQGVWVSAADVWQQYQGSDHCPAWAEFRVAGGAAFPCSATAPPCAMRFQHTGKQQTMHGFVLRGAAATAAAAAAAAAAEQAAASQGSQPRAAAASQQQQQQQQQQQPGIGSLPSGQASQSGRPSRLAPTRGAALSKGKGKGKAAVPPSDGRKQASLFGFGFAPPPPPAQQQQPEQQPEQQQGPALPQDQQQQQQEQQEQQQAAAPPPLPPEYQQAQQAQHEVAKQFWQGIRKQTQAPTCKHGVPAVQKQVTRQNENKGRFFWSCRHPEGPQTKAMSRGGPVVDGVSCGLWFWVQPKDGDYVHLVLPSQRQRHKLRAANSGKRQQGGVDAGGGDKRQKV